MDNARLSVREMSEDDIELIIRYWLNADAVFLRGMGAEIAKMPSENDWKQMLAKQLAQPYTEKKSYAMIWLADDEPVGHSNVNKIVFGKEAYMHLHLWDATARKRGWGAALVKMTLPYFFDNLKLQELFCEPYALNPAPNKTLQKVGFELAAEYTTTPGAISFEQPVKRWRLSHERFSVLT